jgi:hypothetical protein
VEKTNNFADWISPAQNYPRRDDASVSAETEASFDCLREADDMMCEEELMGMSQSGMISYFKDFVNSLTKKRPAGSGDCGGSGARRLRSSPFIVEGDDPPVPPPTPGPPPVPPPVPPPGPQPPPQPQPKPDPAPAPASPAPICPDLFNPIKKYVFVKRVSLELSGNISKSMLTESKDNTLHQCYGDFINFMRTQGSYRTNDTDGIEYNAFNCHNYFACFDLSTSPYKEDISTVIPSVVQSGSIKVKVDFSDPIPEPLVMVTCLFFTNAVELSYKKGVTVSYVNRVN